jgi:hypothetical protein
MGTLPKIIIINQSPYSNANTDSRHYKCTESNLCVKHGHSVVNRIQNGFITYCNTRDLKKTPVSLK